MKELIRFIRTLYLICINSEKREIVIDADTLKHVLDDLKKIDVHLKEQEAELLQQEAELDILRSIYKQESPNKQSVKFE